MYNREIRNEFLMGLGPVFCPSALIPCCKISPNLPYKKWKPSIGID
uniref:Uncharacterized protein n=1 Tax=Rhizophora mucronata TaxID=61149 RepID=A0A2P2NPP8_RHIMU